MWKKDFSSSEKDGEYDIDHETSRIHSESCLQVIFEGSWDEPYSCGVCGQTFRHLGWSFPVKDQAIIFRKYCLSLTLQNQQLG